MNPYSLRSLSGLSGTHSKTLLLLLHSWLRLEVGSEKTDCSPTGQTDELQKIYAPLTNRRQIVGIYVDIPGVLTGPRMFFNGFQNKHKFGANCLDPMVRAAPFNEQISYQTKQSNVTPVPLLAPH